MFLRVKREKLRSGTFGVKAIACRALESISFLFFENKNEKATLLKEMKNRHATSYSDLVLKFPS